MARREILLFGEPILRQKAKRVRNFDKELERLVEDMQETMRQAEGVGLAAPQIGVPLRVTIIEVPEEEPIVLVNPEVVEQQGQRQCSEGCLSYPGYRGVTNRSEIIKVKALDINGEKFRIRADGLLAQALEHEIDHLNGILYTDLLVDKDKIYRTDTLPEDGQPEI